VAAAVVKIRALQAGTRENVIADEAHIELHVRGLDAGGNARVLASITRVRNAEAAAAAGTPGLSP
jgi:metal-dependent amidase/aminoacylase/carboxypeptidase family protein